MGALTALKESGVGLILDEFGSGYCSLGYLRIYPFDAVKIDPRFVAGLVSNPQDRGLVRGIIDLGRAMGARVIGAGVGTDQQLRALQDDRCAEVQGLYLGEAMEPASLTPLLQQQTDLRRSRQGHQAGLHAR